MGGVIGPIALNRNNALLAGHDARVQNWAVIAALIETCKMNGINPHARPTATLIAIVNGQEQSQISALLPWRYTVAVWSAHRLRFTPNLARF